MRSRRPSELRVYDPVRESSLSYNKSILWLSGLPAEPFPRGACAQPPPGRRTAATVPVYPARLTPGLSWDYALEVHLSAPVSRVEVRSWGGDRPRHRGDSEAVGQVTLSQRCSRPAHWQGPSPDPSPETPPLLPASPVHSWRGSPWAGDTFAAKENRSEGLSPIGL